MVRLLTFLAAAALALTVNPQTTLQSVDAGSPDGPVTGG